MKNSLTIIISFVVLIQMISSCSSDPFKELQGIYSVDKVALKASIEANSSEMNLVSSRLMDLIIENAKIEIRIKNDSIYGIMFFAGETAIFETKLEYDGNEYSCVVNETKFNITKVENMVKLSKSGSEIAFEMRKTEQEDFSSSTKEQISLNKKLIKLREEFTSNLGVWRSGNYVDEFGDSIDESYAYTIVEGTHENSISTIDKVFIKIMVETNRFSFQIFDKSLDSKETFPIDETGFMRIKFADGSTATNLIYFEKETFYEGFANPQLYNYIIDNEGIAKVLIDLSSANRYMSDKYLFEFNRSNLLDIISELNP